MPYLLQAPRSLFRSLPLNRSLLPHLSFFVSSFLLGFAPSLSVALGSSWTMCLSMPPFSYSGRFFLSFLLPLPFRSRFSSLFRSVSLASLSFSLFLFRYFCTTRLYSHYANVSPSLLLSIFLVTSFLSIFFLPLPLLFTLQLRSSSPLQLRQRYAPFGALNAFAGIVGGFACLQPAHHGHARRCRPICTQVGQGVQHCPAEAFGDTRVSHQATGENQKCKREQRAGSCAIYIVALWKQKGKSESSVGLCGF